MSGVTAFRFFYTIFQKPCILDFHIYCASFKCDNDSPISRTLQVSRANRVPQADWSIADDEFFNLPLEGGEADALEFGVGRHTSHIQLGLLPIQVKDRVLSW